jgi:hypothetical protein
MTVRRKSNTLLLHAMSWSRYKALLVLLNDSGVTRFLSAGSLQSAQAVQELRMTGTFCDGSSPFAGSETIDAQRTGDREIAKLARTTRCAQFIGDNDGQKLRVRWRCRKM